MLPSRKFVADRIYYLAISVPSLLQNNPDGAFAGFMVSLIIIGIGTGGGEYICAFTMGPSHRNFHSQGECVPSCG